MKKVLIITYYWPPAGGPGVQRVLKFAKYLPEFGWKPIILNVKKGEYPAIDETMAEDIPECCKVYKTNSIEPNFLYKKFTGMKLDEKIPVAVLAEKNQNWKKKVSNWIRINLFIPDAKIGWIPFGVKAGKKIIIKEKPDIIFSSSPPPTVHLIANKLAKWSGIKWVADFRDPWTDIYHYNKIKINSISKNYDKHLENNILHTCKKIIVVNDNFFQDFKNQEKMSIIPNGYDSSDMIPTETPDKNTKFTIRYMGSMKIRQYVDSFFCILKEISKIKNLKNSIRLDIIGRIDPLIVKLIREKNINLEINFTGYLPHKEAIHLIANADLYLFIIGKGNRGKFITTSKIFEYLMMKKPIIAYGPLDGTANKILKKTGAGKMFDYDNKVDAKKYILGLYQKWNQGNIYFKVDLEEIKKYDRKILTQKLVQIFEE